MAQVISLVGWPKLVKFFFFFFMLFHTRNFATFVTTTFYVGAANTVFMELQKSFKPWIEKVSWLQVIPQNKSYHWRSCDYKKPENLATQRMF